MEFYLFNQCLVVAMFYFKLSICRIRVHTIYILCITSVWLLHLNIFFIRSFTHSTNELLNKYIICSLLYIHVHLLHIYRPACHFCKINAKNVHRLKMPMLNFGTAGFAPESRASYLEMPMLDWNYRCSTGTAAIDLVLPVLIWYLPLLAC